MLARKYGVEMLLSPILDFDPSTDLLDKKPFIKRMTRKNLDTPSSTGLEKDDDSDIYNMATELEPRRTRVMSASTVSSPTRSAPYFSQQEATPFNDSLGEKIHASLDSTIFNEDDIQKEFFSAIHSKKRKAKSKLRLQAPLPIEKIKSLTTDQKRCEILMHLYLEIDSPENTTLFKELIRDQDDPSKYEINFILDPRESTLLHIAASFGRIDIASLLITYGAKINAVCCDGETPLMRAINNTRNYEKRSMEALLTMLGPSIFTIDKKKQTALHHAVNLSRFRSKRLVSRYYFTCMYQYIMKTISQTGISVFVDAQDYNNDTALHIACRLRNHKIAALLLSLGASQSIKNNSGLTPNDIASSDYRFSRIMVFTINNRILKMMFLLITVMRRPRL